MSIKEKTLTNNVKILTINHRAKIESEVYVTLCGHSLTIKELMETECPSFISARRLEKNLKKLKVHSVKDLINLGPYSLFNVKGVGVGQVFVAECIINRYTNVTPYGWYKKHLNPKKKRNHEV